MPRSSSSIVYVDSFREGLRTDVSQDKLPEGALAKAENVRFEPDGPIGMRPGNEEVTTWAPGTSTKILALEVMRELDVFICQSGTKILVAKDDESALYTTGVTLTALPCATKEYNGSVKFSNGTDYYTSIAFAKVKTQFTNSDTRIVLNDGYGSLFSASGTVYCKGQAITYTKAIGPTRTQTFTADAGTDVFTANAHGLIDTNTIIVTNSGGALPTGLTSGATYYIITATANTFQLSLTSGGAAINITDAGTGTHSLSSTADVLTGCTIPGAGSPYAVDEIVTQSSASSLSANPKATVLESCFEKMHASGVTIAKHAIYYSVTASVADPTDIDDFASSGAGSELFGKYGRVTAMKSLLTKLYVCKDKGIEAWTGIDSDGLPIRAPFTDAYGCVNKDCLITMGDKLCLFTNQRRFKTIEPDSSGANPEPIINPFFDKKIAGTLRNLDTDQSDANMGYNETDELMRATVMDDTIRKTIIYDALAQAWSIDTGIAANCWVEYKGNMYWGSATTDKIYKAETGYLDGESPPDMDILTPIHYVGDRRRKVPVKELYVTGVIKERTTATITIYCDNTVHRVFTLEGTAPYVSTTTARPFGREFLGLDPLGHAAAGEDEEGGFFFSVPIGINLDCRTVQVRFECQGIGYRVQINSYEIVRGDGPASGETQEDTY